MFIYIMDIFLSMTFTIKSQFVYTGNIIYVGVENK
jgi:hypothetical protein